MTGALLRSGKISTFKALGKTGQPVYRAALKLRNAIQRKSKLDALCLAIPQPDQQGDNIDWYSPVAGDVISWGAATEDEREVARLRLEELKLAITNMRSELLASATANPENSSKDKQVFEQLLEYVIRFPDKDFVYLVRPVADSESQTSDLLPVLTFWGFLHADDVLNADPLYCLYPPKPVMPPVVAPVITPPVAAIVAPLVAPAVAAAVPVTPIPSVIPAVVTAPWWRNWRRWLWLLLFLLLLLLGLFLLRGCTPTLPTLPTLPTIPTLPTKSKVTYPNGGTADQSPGKSLTSGPSVPIKDAALQPNMKIEPNTPKLDGLVTEGGVAAEPNMPELDGSATEGDVTAEPETASLAEDKPINHEPVQEPTNVALPTLPDELAAPIEEPVIPTQGLAQPPLVPANSEVDFLNGNWQAKGGIQDQRTGKPLRLEYQFNNGQGDVTVRRNDGVSCTGPVSAAMKHGDLAINSQGQAKCSDGGVYDMPAVSCKPDAKNMADCIGSYGNEFFPMTMQNAGE